MLSTMRESKNHSLGVHGPSFHLLESQDFVRNKCGEKHTCHLEVLGRKEGIMDFAFVSSYQTKGLECKCIWGGLRVREDMVAENAAGLN